MRFDVRLPLSSQGRWATSLYTSNVVIQILHTILTFIRVIKIKRLLEKHVFYTDMMLMSVLQCVQPEAAATYNQRVRYLL